MNRRFMYDSAVYRFEDRKHNHNAGQQDRILAKYIDIFGLGAQYKDLTKYQDLRGHSATTKILKPELDAREEGLKDEIVNSSHLFVKK